MSIKNTIKISSSEILQLYVKKCSEFSKIIFFSSDLYIIKDNGVLMNCNFNVGRGNTGNFNFPKPNCRIVHCRIQNFFSENNSLKKRAN